MKKTLSLLLTLMLILGSVCALAEDKPAPTAEPLHTPGPNDIIITEESGGEFRPIPIGITNGGAPLPKNIRYDSNMNIYQDPTIRVEYYHRRKAYAPDGDGYFYFYAFVTIGDGSQLRTASAGGSGLS